MTSAGPGQLLDGRRCLGTERDQLVNRLDLEVEHRELEVLAKNGSRDGSAHVADTDDSDLPFANVARHSQRPPSMS